MAPPSSSAVQASANPSPAYSSGSSANLPVSFYCSAQGLQDTDNIDVVNSPTLELIVTDPSGNVACDISNNIRAQVLSKSILLSRDCPNLAGNSYNVMLVSPASPSTNLFFAGDLVQLQSLSINRSSANSAWALPSDIYVMYDSNCDE